MKTSDIAMIIHEANKMYCESIGDLSQVKWAEVPPEIQQSAIDGVAYFMNNPKATSEDMHNNWMKFKLAKGWKHGEEESVFRKTHPNLVEYDDLHNNQQVKDKLFMAICGALLDVD